MIEQEDVSEHFHTGKMILNGISSSKRKLVLITSLLDHCFDVVLQILVEHGPKASARDIQLTSCLLLPG
jgi:hypothetical protein